ncbi:MAG: hypothetical protein ABI859_11685 [Pseudomonadota bacterium]
MALLLLALATGATAAQKTPATPADPRSAVDPALVGGPCDRDCLTGLVDQVLAAYVAHAPAKLPLRAGVRYTENAVVLRLGDGLWATADGLGGYKHYFADAQAGQVGFFGTISESGRLALVSLRLKVDGRKISEIETLVARRTPGPPGGGGPGGGPVQSGYEGMKMMAGMDDVLPVAQRRPRAELLRIADSYFEGLEQATDKVTPFTADCQRYENGTITSNNPASPNAMVQMSCGAQFDTGFSPFITEVRGRRFTVVDEQRGLVFTQLSFDHAGTVKEVQRTDGTVAKVGAPFDTPYTFLIHELFRIKDGRIAQVEAVLLTTPYAMPSGW